MSDVLVMLFGLFGGLAIFIYGMNLMGEGLRKAAGERMRRILAVLTGNPVIAVIVGALVTSILQSSSATTVMVVGFVSARLMTLPQAIGVIMGANIGTTITAQLIAFKIGHYAYAITAIGFILYFFFSKKMVKYVGQIIFAFGLLFVGLNTMGDIMKPLAKSPVFESMMLQIGNVPILGVLVGTLMTVVVQSSSATIAVLQNIASQPTADGAHALISLPAAIPILLGDNIGTTITAVLAAIGARKDAKRAALAHSVFNIVGTFIFIWFIPFFAKFVEMVSPKGAEVDIIARQIANAHTSFNVLNTLIWLPFVWVLAKIVNFIIRGEDEHVENRVLYLDNHVLGNPALAMDLATNELSRMAELAHQMMSSAKKAFADSNMDEVKKVYQIEETVDMLQDEIVKYLSTMLSQGMLTERQSIRLAGLMHVTGDIERIGDHCKNIAEFAEMKINDNLPFSKDAVAEINNAFEMLDTMVEHTIKALHDGSTELAQKVIVEEDEIDDLEDRLRASHIERLNSGLCNPQSTITFIELIHNLERVADHCKNIAEAVLEDNNQTQAAENQADD